MSQKPDVHSGLLNEFSPLLFRYSARNTTPLKRKELYCGLESPFRIFAYIKDQAGREEAKPSPLISVAVIKMRLEMAEDKEKIVLYKLYNVGYVVTNV